MKIADIDYQWDGQQTNEYICRDCGALAIEYIRLKKTEDIEWRY